MSHSGVRILTTSPGAWPWAATPLRCRRCWWSSPEGGGFPSWTLRPPQLGRPSFSSLPCWRGRSLFFLLLVFVGGVASESSANESDTTGHRELFRVPVAFFLAFFSGTM